MTGVLRRRCGRQLWYMVIVAQNWRLQVDHVHTLWGAILGHSTGDSQDLLDLYARQLQLYEDHNPCRQRVLSATLALRSLGGTEEVDRPKTEEGWR